jgi:hypothetical protein
MSLSKNNTQMKEGGATTTAAPSSSSSSWSRLPPMPPHRFGESQCINVSIIFIILFIIKLIFCIILIFLA